MGFLGVLVQFLLKQNAQRHDEHVAAMAAINQQGLSLLENMNALHRIAMDAIAAQGQRMEELHRIAMDAIAAQGRRMEELHRIAMDAITAQGQRMEELHRIQIVSLHEAAAALSERTAVLEAKSEMTKPNAA